MAFQLYLSLAENGDRIAQSKVSDYYMGNVYLKKDPKESMKWFREMLSNTPTC
jgi:TPR repeat protein